MNRKIFLLIASIPFVLIGCDSNSSRKVYYEEEIPSYTNVTCARCSGYGQLASIYGPVQCPDCNGTGYISVPTSGGSNVSFGARTTTLVQTTASCEECGCSGYKGIKHDNGTYEGDCSHSDGYGHPCGHSPEKHGLRKW